MGDRHDPAPVQPLSNGVDAPSDLTRQSNGSRQRNASGSSTTNPAALGV